jgi:SAM-dependent methyltransferase
VGPQGQQVVLSASLYDAVPYPGHPFAQTHPDRLATLATLFGLRPAPIERCRVLELGCGDAGNLVAMAVVLPEGRFVGVDAAPGAIARGRELVEALGLGNVTLEAGAIEDYEPERYDYVIAHGVYSWVAPPVRDRLLALCRAALAPDGVAYVSYNALPGGRARQALRDMLLFHVAGLDEPGERIEQARALLRFLVEGSPPDAELRRHAADLLERSDASLLHDDLAAVNDPVSFHDFAAHAARHRLQYLAEADFFEMQIGAVTEPAAQALLAVEDPLRREQYLDFLKSRMFRQTLLVGDEHAIDRTPRPAVIERLAVSTQVERREGVFEGPTGSRLTTDDPVVIEALERAASSWPAAVWVRDLIDAGAGGAALCDALLRAYAANLVALHVDPPRLATIAGERPCASPLARHQARSGPLVTNLRHVTVRIEDDLGRRLVTLLDGTRDRDALIAELRAFLAERGEEISDAKLRDGLERSLQGLARLALLTG